MVGEEDIVKREIFCEAEMGWIEMKKIVFEMHRPLTATFLRLAPPSILRSVS